MSIRRERKLSDGCMAGLSGRGREEGCEVAGEDCQTGVCEEEEEGCEGGSEEGEVIEEEGEFEEGKSEGEGKGSWDRKMGEGKGEEEVSVRW